MHRRLLPASLLCLAVLAGCGSDSKSSDSSGAAAGTGTSVASPAGTTDTTAASGATATSGTTAGTQSTATVPVPSIPADCPVVTEDTVPDASFPKGKPAVKIPSAVPTKLVVTDLIEGTGDAAKAGDVVTVNYVGVRSADGTEFDNSYDRGETFPVTLGSGGVIKGWDQGLIGIKAGGRRQLDIPAALAYGDQPQGDVIKAGDALTFIVDAVSVAAGPPVADPADAPKVDVPKSVGATTPATKDLVDGDRCLIALPGQTASVQIILYRGDTGEELQNSWTTGHAIDVPLNEKTIQGLVNGIVGMGVGGRRLLILPPAFGFGADGNTKQGLAADTDIILVVDLITLS